MTLQQQLEELAAEIGDGYVSVTCNSKSGHIYAEQCGTFFYGVGHKSDTLEEAIAEIKESGNV